MLTVMLILAVCHCTAAVLAPDGRPYQQIVVATKAPASVKLAAREMQSLLKQMTGTELPVVHEATAKPVICIGEQPMLAAAGINAKGLKSETWVCRTGKDFLAIYGDDYNGPSIEGVGRP